MTNNTNNNKMDDILKTINSKTSSINNDTSCSAGSIESCISSDSGPETVCSASISCTPVSNFGKCINCGIRKRVPLSYDYLHNNNQCGGNCILCANGGNASTFAHMTLLQQWDIEKEAEKKELQTMFEGDPIITTFTRNYPRHSNFAIESIEQSFSFELPNQNDK